MWHVVYTGAGEFGDSHGLSSAVVDVHPYLWAKKRDQQSQGHWVTTIISWQRLDAEDYFAYKKSKE